MGSNVLHLSIDRFGRIVLPKEIRDRFGVKAGTEFEVEEKGDAILLKPVQKQAKIIYKDGLPVLSVGEPITNEMVKEAIESSRREKRWTW